MTTVISATHKSLDLLLTTPDQVDATALAFLDGDGG